jgi:hypothetical protein
VKKEIQLARRDMRGMLGYGRGEGNQPEKNLPQSKGPAGPEHSSRPCFAAS